MTVPYKGTRLWPTHKAAALHSRQLGIIGSEVRHLLASRMSVDTTVLATLISLNTIIYGALASQND